MMKRYLRFFQRFRWKMAISGMVATAATMMVVSLVYVLVFATRERKALLEEDIPARVEQALARYTADVRERLLPEPPDVTAIEAWIATEQKMGRSWLQLRGEADCHNCGVRVDVPVLVVAGPDGRVLVATPDGPEPGAPLAEAVPEEGRRALALVDETRERSTIRDAAGDTFSAMPVVTRAGELRGVVYAHVASAPPTIGSTMRRFFRFVPSGLVEILPFALVLGTVFSLWTSRGLLKRLRSLGDASHAWSRGDFNVRVRDRKGDELGELGRELDQMADRLGTLLETRQELAALEERNHLARELHDTVKQEIFSISMLLGTVETLVDKDRAEAMKLLGEARELSGRAGRELNALILHLRPAALDGKGLASALREYCEDWSRKLGIESHVRVQGERELPLELEQSLFRVAQEALANVAWHSRSKAVDVHLAISDDLTLSVRDDGQGFDPSGAESRGFGLRGMRERMEQLGGRLEVRAEPGAGTLLVAECPIH